MLLPCPNLVTQLRERLAPLGCDVDDWTHVPLGAWDPAVEPMRILLKDELGPCGLVEVRPRNEGGDLRDDCTVDDRHLSMKGGPQRSALVRAIREVVNGQS